MDARKTAPEGFDIIIDDASHFGDLTKIAFWHLLDNHLKPSGLYVIEDWGTGYWSDWPGGKSDRPRSIRPTGSNEVGCKFDLVEPIAFLVDQRSDHGYPWRTGAQREVAQ